MSERNVIENKIKRKESEIQSLERKLNTARIYLQALKDIQGAFENDAADEGSSGDSSQKGECGGTGA